MTSCKSALTPIPRPVVYSTDSSKAVVVLLFAALWLLYEPICFKSYLVLFCSCVFSPLSIAITSLGEVRANLSAFHTFVRFALVWFCLFPLPLCVRDGLEFVIVALPRLLRRPTGDQEVAGSTPAEVGNILSWRLIMKYFLRSFSPFH